MVNPASDLLQVDPAKIALGDNSEAARAADQPDAGGPACAASVSAFRSALFFKNIFTSIMAVLALVAAGALIFVIVNAVKDGWDPTNTLAAIVAVVTGGGAVFLQKERTQAQEVLDKSLADVQKYCGEELSDQLS